MKNCYAIKNEKPDSLRSLRHELTHHEYDIKNKALRVNSVLI